MRSRRCGDEIPLRAAEQRRRAGRSRRGLSESSRRWCLRGRVPQPPGASSSAGKGTLEAEQKAVGPANRGPPSLGYLSWRSKKGDQPPGGPRRTCCRRSRTLNSKLTCNAKRLRPPALEFITGSNHQLARMRLNASSADFCSV